MTLSLSDPITLPCGALIPNRLAKAAMTEGLATPDGVPTPELERLYGLWSDGGAGMLLSGNIQIDRDHLERPGNVVIDREPDAAMHAALSSWAKVATRNGNHFWAQISHAGRQTMKMINPHPKAPSPLKLGLPGGQFGEPVALEKDEIVEIVRRFAQCAVAVQAAGFTGVQVHAAHGYLLSQFLSPRSNQRSDEYGGSLENRARLLMDTVAAIRTAVGREFPISVKLNSADFQKGGFDFADSLQVVEWLEKAGVDLIEISGGTYEQPKLLGVQGLEAEEPQAVAQSTQQREAYFVDFALAMRDKVSVPLMVTGGFRQKQAMQQALSSGAADVIGLGRPMCVMTDAPAQLLAGLEELPRYEQQLALFPEWLAFLSKINALKVMATFAVQYWYYAQIDRLGRTGKAEPALSVFQASKDVTALQKELVKARSR
ncbi:MAG: NADH:flavin oxidoreductase/NADH oxidase family protein [Pseudomonas sp.]|uniref:NADH:flavin oxidoreductase/NADH oxidase family protein n=1 Tax=Halopseudomonas laoshanensis TaxID=2268758 RepID=UPI001B405DCB|nr:NADH:flavin oxidoreductase/NADH oxidase family protein [Pseudomonas sp.]MBQ0776617.1 NADH:flavin oxidoreductase/NADH oxidase family protein [Pseudomonas sp.]